MWIPEKITIIVPSMPGPEKLVADRLVGSHPGSFDCAISRILGLPSLRTTR
jgi:hypothetical protein